MTSEIMVRALTSEQVQAERAQDNYIQHLDLKPSSCKFYFKSNPTPTQQRKGGPWGWYVSLLLCGTDGVLSTISTVCGVVGEPSLE